MYLTIGDIFDQTVSKFPSKEALVYIQKNQRWTYYEWSIKVNELANAFLDEGIKKGDRISTLLYNTSEFATVYFACAKIGAIFNPINYRLKSEELLYIINDAEPKIVIFEEELKSEVSKLVDQNNELSYWYVDNNCPSYASCYYDKLERSPSNHIIPNVSEEEICSIMYTSGTTGRPKGVMHRHRDIIEQSMLVINAMNYTDKDRGLVIAPVFNGAELNCGFFPRVHVGGCNVMTHHFEVKEGLDIIENESITTMFAVPTMWKMMLQKDLSKYNFKHMRTGLYGGESMSPIVVSSIYSEFDIKLTQAYGMTEMGPTVSFLTNDDHFEKPGSAGKACLNHEIRIVQKDEEGSFEPDNITEIGEVGEIIVKGTCMMVGYYNQEKSTRESIRNGWYYSGDLGYFDQDGYLWIVDRANNMIVSGGENIYPREVEEVLSLHPDVLDVAVIGLPDDKWGECVIAFVIRRNEGLTERELEDHCKDSHGLANYKRPRHYFFVEELPRSTNGKLQRFALRERYKEIELNL